MHILYLVAYMPDNDQLYDSRRERGYIEHSNLICALDQLRAHQQAQPGTSLTTRTNTFPCPADRGAQVHATRNRTPQPIAHKINSRKGHEDPATTQPYLHADMKIKEQALARVQPTGTKPGRYHAPDTLMAFLSNL
jgi:hypothetical protein